VGFCTKVFDAILAVLFLCVVLICYPYILLYIFNVFFILVYLY